MPSVLIRQVADYCWSNNFLDVFHKFFKDHAEAFIGAPEMCGGEHNMEYYNLFTLYLEVYEATLTDYLVTLDKGVEEFYAEVRESQDDSMDPYLKTFVDCLLASADYESFYKVMIREGKKKATQLKKEALKAEVKEGVQPSPSQGAPEWDSGNGNPSDSKGLSLEQPDEKASSPHRGGSSSDYGADAKDAASSPGRDEKGQDDYK